MPGTRGGRYRANTAAPRAGQPYPVDSAYPPPRHRRAWRVSESFPELAQAVREHAQPDRIDIVRAKRHLLGQLGDGHPHPASTLMASVATLLGAEPLASPG